MRNYYQLRSGGSLKLWGGNPQNSCERILGRTGLPADPSSTFQYRNGKLSGVASLDVGMLAPRVTATISNQACGLQRSVCAVLIDRLQSACRELNSHVAAEFRNPNALVAKVRRKGSLHLFDMVQPNAALLLSRGRCGEFCCPACAGHLFMLQTLAIMEGLVA